ncbi:class I SAM-dependent methyltransferase [Rubripirellula tenax]|uniref:class I SAM-dependent methyltransferase n=1 Tax=Rubripirellula tenax TaxID=2528015 RepID=UPI0016497897|nr:class I SAM-dependent methyltransferase [Rubripirellula tenax]
MNGYDRIARFYRVMEWAAFGPHLNRSRVAILSDLPAVSRVLVLGDGDGRLLQRLCLEHPDATIVSVDQSPKMLELQRRRVKAIGGEDRAEWIQCDAIDFSPEPGRFDLLVTAYFLDCFTESQLETNLTKWLAGVRDGGCWYVVEFTRPASKLQRVVADPILWMMHAFFRWQTGLPNRSLVDLNPILGRLPIRMVKRQTRFCGMMTSRIYAKMPLTSSP